MPLLSIWPKHLTQRLGFDSRGSCKIQTRWAGPVTRIGDDRFPKINFWKAVQWLPCQKNVIKEIQRRHPLKHPVKLTDEDWTAQETLAAKHHRSHHCLWELLRLKRKEKKHRSKNNSAATVPTNSQTFLSCHLIEIPHQPSALLHQAKNAFRNFLLRNDKPLYYIYERFVNFCEWVATSQSTLNIHLCFFFNLLRTKSKRYDIQNLFYFML